MNDKIKNLINLKNKIDALTLSPFEKQTYEKLKIEAYYTLNTKRLEDFLLDRCISNL